MPFKDSEGSSVSTPATGRFYFNPYPLVEGENQFKGTTKELAEEARDTYFTDNASLLAEYDVDALRMISVEWEVDSVDQYQVQTRFGGSWVGLSEDLPSPLEIKTLLEANADTDTLNDGEKLLVSDLLTVEEGRLPYLSAGRAVTSPYRVTDRGAFVEGKAHFEGGTLFIGTVVSTSDYGGFLGLTNAITGNRFRIPDFRVSEGAASARIRRLADIEGLTPYAITTTNDTELESPIAFEYTVTQQATTLAFEIQVSEPLTNLRMKITNVSPDVLGVPIKYWPSEAAWLDDTGTDIPLGTQTISLRDSPLPFSMGRKINIEAKYDTGKVLGDSEGIPAFSVQLQQGRWIESQDALEEVSVTLDGDSHQTLVNQSITATLSSDGTLLLPTGAVDGDLLLVQKVVFVGGTKLTIANPDNSFITVHNSIDGTASTDTSLETTTATPRLFKYVSGGWGIYL